MSFVTFFLLIIYIAILLSPLLLVIVIVQSHRKNKGQKTTITAVRDAVTSGTVTTTNLHTLLGGSLALGFMTWYLYKPGAFGLQTPIIVCLFVWLLLSAAGMYKSKISTPVALLCGAALACTAFVAIRSSPSLTALNIFGAVAFLCIALLGLSGRTFSDLHIFDYIESSMLPLMSLPGSAGLLYANRELVRSKKSTTPGGLLSGVKVSKDVVVGLSIAVPLLVVFTVLFASADSRFSDLLPNLRIPDWQISTELLQALIVTLSVGAILASMLFYNFVLSSRSHDAQKSATSKPGVRLSQTSALIILGSVVGLFAVFGILQLPVVFGADVLSETTNLSDGARRGFGQLVVASMVVFGLLAFVEHAVPKKAVDSRFKSLSIALVVLTFVVLASAFVRLLAAEAEFGFTVVRLFGHSFMIILGIWLALLLVKMLQNFSWAQFSQMFLVSCFGYIMVMNLINPDAMIARTNIGRSDVREIDVSYLRRLSPDAWPAIENGLQSGTLSQGDATFLIDGTCRDNYRLLQKRNTDDWRTWNKANQTYINAIDRSYSSYESCK